MRRSIVLVMAIVSVLLFALSGCSQPKSQQSTINESIDLYYALKGNIGLDKEQRTITYKTDEEKYNKTLQEWLNGPQDKAKYEPAVQPGAKILGITRDQNKLNINLSKEFGQFSGVMNEGATIASLVNTMVQFIEIDNVKIQVEGADLLAPSGKPYGYMSEILFNPNETGNLKSMEVTLYFGDEQAMYVVPEKRTIYIEENASKDRLIKALIEELIKGPVTKGLYPTIPAEAKVNYVTVTGERAKIDFSEEMYTKHSRGAAGEDMTLTSIANTVTEIQGIKEVVLTVNDKPLNLDLAVVDDNNPLVRMENKIKKQ